MEVEIRKKERKKLYQSIQYTYRQRTYKCN